MNFHELIKLALDHGLVLKILFLEKNKRTFAIITGGKWAKKYKLTSTKGEVIDILRDQPIILPTTIDTIEYLFMPKDFNLRQFLNTNDTVLTIPNFFKCLNKEVQLTRLYYKEYVYSHLKEFKKLNLQTLRDSFFIRYYPQSLDLKNKNEIFSKIKDDITDKYFLLEAEQQENQSALSACIRLGISDKWLDTKDINLINCCKRRWFNIISEERNNLVKELNIQINLTKKKKLNKKAKGNALRQLSEYKKLLKAINIRHMRSCQTLKDIISFWPSLMQPKPLFVYER